MRISVEAASSNPKSVGAVAAAIRSWDLAGQCTPESQGTSRLATTFCIHTGDLAVTLPGSRPAVGLGRRAASLSHGRCPALAARGQNRTCPISLALAGYGGSSH